MNKINENDAEATTQLDIELATKLIDIDHARISSIDTTEFIIKGWTITLVSGLIGFALTVKDPNTGKIFLLIGIFATSIFFLLDKIYKKIQNSHIIRAWTILQAIEEHNSENSALKKAIYKNYFKDSYSIFKNYEFLFYIPIIFILFLAFVRYPAP
jgi:hypothetical protein